MFFFIRVPCDVMVVICDAYLSKCSAIVYSDIATVHTSVLNHYAWDQQSMENICATPHRARTPQVATRLIFIQVRSLPSYVVRASSSCLSLCVSLKGSVNLNYRRKFPRCRRYPRRLRSRWLWWRKKRDVGRETCSASALLDIATVRASLPSHCAWDRRRTANTRATRHRATRTGLHVPKVCGRFPRNADNDRFATPYRYAATV